jgi:hypothetical protein
MRSHFHRQEWLGGLPVAQSWNVLVKPMVSLRAWGARPSAGDRPRQDGLMGESPEMSRKAVFPEGRGLRVRVARPYASPGISFPPHVSKMTRGPSGDMCQLGPSHPCGRAEPAPSRGRQAHYGWLIGEDLATTSRALFSEGRTLCARVARPYASRGIT